MMLHSVSRRAALARFRSYTNHTTSAFTKLPVTSKTRDNGHAGLAAVATPPLLLPVAPFTTSSRTATDNIIRCKRPDLEIPDASLTEILFKRFNDYTDYVALVDSTTGQGYTYGQFQEKVIKVASALTKLGFKKGDVCTLFSPNCPEFGMAFLGVAATGGVTSAYNPLSNVEELARQLSHSGAKIIIAHSMLISTAKAAAKIHGNIKEIIVIGESEGCRPFSQLCEDDGKAFPENVDINPKEDMVAMPYSSGTTGLPKGVMLSHRNILANIEQISGKDVMGYEPNKDILLGILPFFHIYGLVVALLTGLSAGTKIVTMPRFQEEPFLKTIETYRCTFLHLVPPLILFLGKHPMVENYNLDSVRTIFSGAAPLAEAQVKEALSRLPPHALVRQGYGLTETSPVTHGAPPTQDAKLASIGTVIQNTLAKIVDVETGAVLGAGQDGELCVKGPQVMLGYLDNPQATADTVDEEGWLHTGDIAHYDEDEHFFIVDRLKELIKYKGFQVPPAELEGLILTHPSVQDVAVIGVPDDEAGELPRAFVVKKPNMEITAEEVKEFVEKHVSPYKKLRGGVQFLDEIPKSAAGKILRRLLKDML